MGSCHCLFSPYSGRWGQQWQGHDFSRAPTCRYQLWRSHTIVFPSSPLVWACVFDLGGLHSSSRTGPFTSIPLFLRARWPHTSSQSAYVQSILSYSMPVICCVHWSHFDNWPNYPPWPPPWSDAIPRFDCYVTTTTTIHYWTVTIMTRKYRSFVDPHPTWNCPLRSCGRIPDRVVWS
jgi:hypothetical protein